ncbi:serine/arginine-rich splicing factor 4-like [Galleria mellonella]|uniref:Serine/arginine-rich splicing factor 4-like n=1 Tax=Galleria mellonella TaxID=7137 RepID=A0A6J1WWY5_GALME|nr:serine/arginine-rich splicing factor 4-like [Galleria mellonella]
MSNTKKKKTKFDSDVFHGKYLQLYHLLLLLLYIFTILMEGYPYPYPPPFPPMRSPEGEYPDHGDGFGDYYGMEVLNDYELGERPSRSKNRSRKHYNSRRSHSRSITAKKTQTRSRSRSRSSSQSRSRTRSRSPSRSRSRSRTRSRSASRMRIYKEPGFLDAFRVLYLTPSKQQRSTTKYLATKKKQDHIQEILKSDGLGSKRWLFYPRSQNSCEPITQPVAGSRDNCDQRVKIDGEFFRKYKRRSKVASDAPIAKLKRWELIFYKKLGFIQAV